MLCTKLVPTASVILHIFTRAIQILSLLDIFSTLIFVKPCASLDIFCFIQSEQQGFFFFLLSVNGEKNRYQGNNKQNVSALSSS